MDEMNTDLDRLHKVVMSEDHERGDGVTFAICHGLAGIMETDKQSGVHCKVVSYDRVTRIMEELVFKVFPDHGIEFEKTIHKNSYSFILPDGTRKRINFILFNDETALRGSLWPVVEFLESFKERTRDYGQEKYRIE